MPNEHAPEQLYLLLIAIASNKLAEPRSETTQNRQLWIISKPDCTTLAVSKYSTILRMMQHLAYFHFS
jgi:hypothetical protein